MIHLGTEKLLTSTQLCRLAGIRDYQLNYAARQGIVAPVSVIPGRRLWAVNCVEKLTQFYKNRGAGRVLAGGVANVELSRATKQ